MSRLKLDENLSRHLKDGLARLGHDVQTVADEGLLSRPDHVVAAAANEEGRFLGPGTRAHADSASRGPALKRSKGNKWRGFKRSLTSKQKGC